MSENPFQKAEKDFTSILDEEFPQIDQLAKSDYKSALDKLLLLEKQTRQASDLASSKKVMVKLVDLLTEKRDWDLLDEQIAPLSKKHGQFKESIQILVQEVISKLDKIIDLDVKLKLIDTIRTVTENKIYVEIERARTTKILSDILLNEKKDLDKACETLNELQVETYGSMEMDEKITFILDQMTLNNKKGDFQFSKILSRKILLRVLDKYADHKLRYYELMIQIALFEDDYMNIVKYYLNIYNIPKINGDSTESLKILNQIVLFIILTPYSNLQNDLISRIKIDKNLIKLPLEQSLIKSFTTQELINWKAFENQIISQLEKLDAFNTSTEKGKIHSADLKQRIIEFNLRIISKYYSSIKIDRLCELIQLDQLQTEMTIIEMVSKGELYAKINRPMKIVKFTKPKNENQLLNEWSGNIDKLLESIESIEHLINKEEMLHAVK
ncbi:proteasome regulatory particle lid subunit [Martiniozyma asiatica (nom. inval.)]|nr:proteasome regulatory particle lid subunit [Martiniozyma asiatica]